MSPHAEGEDYTGREFFVMFPPGSTKESFTIQIINDNVFESDEMFSLTLETPQPAQTIGVMRAVPFMATVTIINDECESTFNCFYCKFPCSSFTVARWRISMFWKGREIMYGKDKASV